MPESPYNPYAPPLPGPPSEGLAEGRTSDRAPGETLKWIYAGSAFVSLVASLAQAAGLADAGIVVGLLAVVTGGVALGWIFQAWNGVPARFRKGVSPFGALGGLIIPVFNIYWFFAVNAQLCTALDAALTDADEEPRAPRRLAQLAPFAQAAAAWTGWFVSFIPALEAHPLVAALVRGTCGAGVHAIWFVYMLRCDEVRREVARRSPRTEKLASLWPLLILSSLAVLLFLAIWNFLSPASPRPVGAPSRKAVAP